MVNMKPKFSDDDPEVCDSCNEWIWPGYDFYVWHGGTYCSHDCVKEAMFEAYEDDVTEKQVHTASDHEQMWREELREGRL